MDLEIIDINKEDRPLWTDGTNPDKKWRCPKCQAWTFGTHLESIDEIKADPLCVFCRHEGEGAGGNHD